MDQNNMNAQALLTQVNAAISAIMVGGQSYKIGSRSLTRANLAELCALRDRLTAEATADSNLLPGVTVAEFLPR